MEAGNPMLSESLQGTAYEPEKVPTGEVIGTVYKGSAPTPEIGVQVTVLHSGAVGEEWNHTPPEATGDLPLLLELWHGTGLLYLQTPTGRDLTDTVYTPLKPGDRAIIPPEWAFRISNVGETPLVFATFRSTKHPLESKSLEPLNGLAHYVLAEKSDSFDWELNSKYRSVPVPREVKPQASPALGIHNGSPILAAFAKDATPFRWLTAPDDFADTLNSLYEEEGW
jgi:oxalate decarboxylase/phosphoglucose isomerase-like protein (cupin superfamily)